MSTCPSFFFKVVWTSVNLVDNCSVSFSFFCHQIYSIYPIRVSCLQKRIHKISPVVLLTLSVLQRRMFLLTYSDFILYYFFNLGNHKILAYFLFSHVSQLILVFFLRFWECFRKGTFIVWDVVFSNCAVQPNLLNLSKSTEIYLEFAIFHAP